MEKELVQEEKRIFKEIMEIYTREYEPLDYLSRSVWRRFTSFYNRNDKYRNMLQIIADANGLNINEIGNETREEIYNIAFMDFFDENSEDIINDFINDHTHNIQYHDENYNNLIRDLIRDLKNVRATYYANLTPNKLARAVMGKKKSKKKRSTKSKALIQFQLYR
jgi:hypothetical protein